MAVLAILISSTIAEAASIVIDSPGMQAIFSQSTFDGTHINIRFNPAKVIVAPELLDIKTTADLRTLYSLAPDPAPTVDAFFVDQLEACSSVEPTIKNCDKFSDLNAARGNGDFLSEASMRRPASAK